MSDQTTERTRGATSRVVQEASYSKASSRSPGADTSESETFLGLYGGEGEGAAEPGYNTTGRRTSLGAEEGG